MEYRVRFVPDELLNGQVWAIFSDAAEGVTTLYLAESSMEMTATEKERHLEDAWEGYRLMSSPVIPTQYRRVNS